MEAVESLCCNSEQSKTSCEGGGRAHEHSTEDKNNRNTKTGANQQSNNRNQVNEGDEQ